MKTEDIKMKANLKYEQILNNITILESLNVLQWCTEHMCMLLCKRKEQSLVKIRKYTGKRVNRHMHERDLEAMQEEETLCSCSVLDSHICGKDFPECFFIFGFQTKIISVYFVICDGICLKQISQRVCVCAFVLVV